MKNNDLITLNNVIKNFEKSKALDDVSFSIPKNSIFGLLGPNAVSYTHLTLPTICSV